MSAASVTSPRPAREVVAEFIDLVRRDGNLEAATRLMAAQVRCHQVVSEAPATVVRTPGEYVEHVAEMRSMFGQFKLEVTETIAEDDRVYVRWRQEGADRFRSDGRAGTGRPVVEVASAVYRVVDDKISEYWIQVDRWGMQAQLESVDGDVLR